MPTRKRSRHANPHQPALPECDSPPRGYARRKHFGMNPTGDEAAAVIRGVYADALDKSFTDGPLGLVLWQGDLFTDAARAFCDKLFDLAADGDRAGVLKLLRAWGLRVFADVSVALFPELFTKDAAAEGIVTPNPERVGVDRLKAFAEMLTRGAA